MAGWASNFLENYEVAADLEEVEKGAAGRVEPRVSADAPAAEVRQGWSVLVPGNVKLNCDAAANNDSANFRVGTFVHDDGQFMMGLAAASFAGGFGMEICS